MLRPLYRCVLRLHPRGFRHRFADEMLSIFDHTAGKLPALRLLLDGLSSLVRQWTLRPQFWRERPIAPASPPAIEGKGIPSFYTLEPFRPHAGAVIQGLVLSLILFCTTCVAIKYSWIHILHIQIPEDESDSPQWMSPKPGGDTVAKTTTQPVALPSPQNKPPIASSSAQRPTVTAPPQVPPEVMSAQNGAVQAVTTDNPQNARLSNRGSSTTVLTQTTLQAYVGNYIAQSPNYLTLSIATESGHLVVGIPGQPKHELIQVSETKFIVSGMEDCWIVFVRDHDGTIRQLEFFQKGREFTASRQ